MCLQIKPEMKLIEKSVSTYALVAMVHDTAENQHAMSSPVSSPEEIEGKFDRISYSKGKLAPNAVHIQISRRNGP